MENYYNLQVLNLGLNDGETIEQSGSTYSKALDQQPRQHASQTPGVRNSKSGRCQFLVVIQLMLFAFHHVDCLPLGA